MFRNPAVVTMVLWVGLIMATKVMIGMAGHFVEHAELLGRNATKFE